MNELPKELAATFDRIRGEEGDETYNEARRSFIRSYASRPGAEEVLPEWFPDLDVKAIIAEAAEGEHSCCGGGGCGGGKAPQLQSLMPSAKTKVQQDVAILCFEALKTLLDASFSGNLVAANLARSTLDQGLEVALKVSGMQEQVEQIPEEQRSSQAQRFITPTGQDAEIVDRLLAELERVQSMEDLQYWYINTTLQRNKVEEQAQRDRLYDTIRAKRKFL